MMTGYGRTFNNSELVPDFDAEIDKIRCFFFSFFFFILVVVSFLTNVGHHVTL